jgi:hypothetical protein
VLARGGGEHAVRQIGLRAQRRGADQALDVAPGAESRGGLLELAARDQGRDEQLEDGEPLQGERLGQPAQQPLAELDRAAGPALVERQARPAELRPWRRASRVEQRLGLPRPALSPPQLGQGGDRRAGHRRARPAEVLDRAGQQRLSLQPAPAPEVRVPYSARQKASTYRLP